MATGHPRYRVSMDVAEFLAARLSEKERQGRHGWTMFIIDPTVVLREVEAARLLLADFRAACEAVTAYENHDGEWTGTPEEWAETGLRLRHVADTLFRQVKIRAAVYRDHEGYKPEWAPA